MIQTESIKWPYPIRYGVENEVDADVLVLGGGMAGAMAAITAAKRGMNVILVDKGSTIHSGAAGSGFDHWIGCPNPASPITAEELTDIYVGLGTYTSGITKYIQYKEAYDCLLELESYGAKVRDTDDVFKGSEFRDESTKLLFATDYVNRWELRVWGRTFKPSLYKELKRAGVKLYERVMATSLLNEKGKQGSRVVGATGVNVRTGEFIIFRAKATILCLANPQGRCWIHATEIRGLGGRNIHINAGEGHSMAWRAGAELTNMEKSSIVRRPRPTTEGSHMTSWFPCSIVDTQGKEVPWVDRDGNVLTKFSDRCKPVAGQKLLIPAGGPPQNQAADRYYPYRAPSPIRDLDKRIADGEFIPPLYCDFPNMPEDERRVIYGLMIGQEGTTWLAYHNMTKAGFDPYKHQLQIYEEKPGVPAGFGWRRQSGGGVILDWDLKTNLEGLYAAGDQIAEGVGVAHAITTGRYAARKASEYATKALQPSLSRHQIDAEKSRIYTFVQRKQGMPWKELAAGQANIMQHYCSDIKNEERLKLGLRWFDELLEGEAQNVCARNPHELMRTLEIFSLIDCCQAIIHQCLARKASSALLNFRRLDYPEMDPLKWHKWVTTRQVDGQVKAGERPIHYWGDLQANYEKHCGL